MSANSRRSSHESTLPIQVTDVETSASMALPGSSPQSELTLSNEGTPNNGQDLETPGTKLSNYSPDDVRGDVRIIANSGIKIAQPPTFTLQSTTGRSQVPGLNLAVLKNAAQDPFTSDSKSLEPVNTTVGRKLSPTAAVYAPTTAASTAFDQANGGGGIQYLNATSLPDHLTRPVRSSQTILSASSQSISGHAVVQIDMPVASTETTSHQLALNRFSTSGLSTRYLEISGISRTVAESQLDSIFHDPYFGPPQVIVTTQLSSDGTIYVKFSDLRDSDTAYRRLQNTQRGWYVTFIGAQDFAIHYVHLKDSRLSDFEGQILVTAHVLPEGKQYEAAELELLVLHMLKMIGGILASEVLGAVDAKLAMRVEYFLATHAVTAVQYLNGRQVAGLRLQVSAYAPDLMDGSLPIYGRRHPIIVSGNEVDLIRDMSAIDISDRMLTRPNPRLLHEQRLNLAPPQQTPFSNSVPKATVNTSSSSTFPSPGDTRLPMTWPRNPVNHVSTNFPPSDDFQRSPAPFNQHLSHPNFTPRMGSQSRGGSCQQQSPRSLRRTNDYSSGNHNIVDIGRIQAGLDVRTTIMLRNIPNKVDQSALRELVDTTSRGKYDFMYLRIDFANNCNVGYAFINFEDPYHIIDFVRARAGNRWDQFNSDKVAEVSYATIQGKDCLIQKFRNSSVMLESPSFRPKIFRTGNGPDAGVEDAFPLPDNPSKMRRSIENAEHVGLFAPRLGQQFRDEQRRRRSQYDRGTRLAELEDANNLPDVAQFNAARTNSTTYFRSSTINGPGINHRGY